MTACAKCGAEGVVTDANDPGVPAHGTWVQCSDREACSLRASLRDATAEIARLRVVAADLADELECAVAEAERVRGGMHAPFLEPLSSAIRLPSFVTWARKTAKRLREASQ